jgi:hypothetical protein
LLPFEDNLPFESLPFEDEDQTKTPIQWGMNPGDDRDPKALKHDFEQMGPLRQAGELAVGTPEAALSMASTLLLTSCCLLKNPLLVLLVKHCSKELWLLLRVFMV